MPWQDPQPQQDLLTPELCFPIQGEPPLILLETHAGCQGRGSGRYHHTQDPQWDSSLTAGGQPTLWPWRPHRAVHQVSSPHMGTWGTSP